MRDIIGWLGGGRDIILLVECISTAAWLTGDEAFSFLKEIVLYSSVKQHSAYSNHRH